MAVVWFLPLQIGGAGISWAIIRSSCSDMRTETVSLIQCTPESNEVYIVGKESWGILGVCECDIP